MSRILKTFLLGVLLGLAATACKKVEQATEGSADAAKQAANELKAKTVDAANEAVAATKVAADKTVAATNEAADQISDAAKEKIQEVKADHN